MSVVYDNTNATYDNGFAIGYNNIHNMYYERGVIPTFNFIQDLETTYKKQACIDDYIESLKDKYDTLIGEGGVNLSGGQKQRLAIARTLAKKSSIILFDEATSALDNESQAFIKKSIDSLVKNHTIIIVAHRLSTIVDADIIYVVNDGKVVDYGTHKDLLKKSDYYKTLYENEE